MRGATWGRRVAKIGTLLACALMALVVLTACGGNPAEEATQAFDEQMKQELSLSSDAVKEELGSTLQDFEEMGVDADEFYQALIAHFSYKVDQAEATADNSVTLTVSSTNVDLTQIMSTWQEQVTNYVQEQISSGNASTDPNVHSQAVTKMLIDDMNAADAPLTTATNSVIMEKDSNGDWSMANPADLSNVIFPNMDL